MGLDSSFILHTSSLLMNLRTRVELFKASGEWRDVTIAHTLPPAETAALLCDVWDTHWCASAVRRCKVIVQRMVPVVDSLRARGVQIIHAPSECMAFYAETPQRRRMQLLPPAEPPEPLQIDEPPLPIDHSDYGCDDIPQCPVHFPWTRQHAALPIADEDGISDSGDEVYNLLRQRGITNLLIMGVHTNMCVLNRSFAIRAMTRRGVRCILVRDLTDTMYNPRMSPFVSHDEGTALVVEHIEKYLCPTVESADLV